MDAILDAVRKGEIARLEAALDRDPAAARKPRPILSAAGAANLAAVKVLIKHGADPNALWRGYRPLHTLIQEEPHASSSPSPARLECLDWLLGHGADPELPAAWPPARAIVVAAFSGARPFVEHLRAGGARIDGFAACALGKTASVGRELKKSPAFASARDVGGLTALQCCAGSRLGGNDRGARGRLLEIASLLLDAGADPNVKTRSWSHDIDAAYLAISARNAGLLDLLLTRGADANAALPPAAWSADHTFAEIVLRHGAVVNEATTDGRPLLNELVRWGQIHQALWLLGRGADPNRPDSRGWTALHQAASRGNERIFKALLDAGGDPRRKDTGGDTPFDVALDKGRKKILRLRQEPER